MFPSFNRRKNKLMNLRHILVPVDFSGRTVGVLQVARSIAEKFGARISPLNVVHRPISAIPVGPYVPDWDPQEIESYARTLLDQLGDFSSVEVLQFVEIGDPATVIVDFAKQNLVDLIMMPTHGYGKFRGLLLGSVTAKVLHDATCPVWTTAHREVDSDEGLLPKRLSLSGIE